MKYLIFLCLFIVGCENGSFRTLFKCHDGVLYLKDNGAWIQAKMYENNKCLPLESDK